MSRDQSAAATWMDHSIQFYLSIYLSIYPKSILVLQELLLLHLTPLGKLNFFFLFFYSKAAKNFKAINSCFSSTSSSFPFFFSLRASVVINGCKKLNFPSLNSHIFFFGYNLKLRVNKVVNSPNSVLLLWESIAIFVGKN